MYCAYVKVGLAPVAQWIERKIADLEAAGPNPAGRAKRDPPAQIAWGQEGAEYHYGTEYGSPSI